MRTRRSILLSTEFGVLIGEGERGPAGGDENVLIADDVGDFEIREAVKTHQGPIACLKQVIYPTG